MTVKKDSPAEVEIKVPAVFASMAAVMKYLSVGKDGKLPGNMGSSSYHRAHDVAEEVKKQFTKHDLIILPHEEIVSEEHIIFKDRLNIRVLVQGTYTIISILDGSQVVVTGLGDGLATGTAVACNIGSTNALKNALLRTFLITEKAVEESMLTDMVNASSNTPPAPTNALAKAQAKKSGSTASWRSKVRADFLDTEKVDKVTINALMSAAQEEGLTGDKIWEQVYSALAAK